MVSSINSPTIYLATFLNNILTKALPKPLSSIKNTQYLIDVLSNVTFPENHIIKKVTKLPIDELKKGIKFVMDSTYYKFDNKYHKQIFGTPMASPISPIIADIVM